MAAAGQLDITGAEDLAGQGVRLFFNLDDVAISAVTPLLEIAAALTDG